MIFKKSCELHYGIRLQVYQSVFNNGKLYVVHGGGWHSLLSPSISDNETYTPCEYTSCIFQIWKSIATHRFIFHESFKNPVSILSSLWAMKPAEMRELWFFKSTKGLNGKGHATEMRLVILKLIEYKIFLEIRADRHYLWLMKSCWETSLASWDWESVINVSFLLAYKIKAENNLKYAFSNVL